MEAWKQRHKHTHPHYYLQRTTTGEPNNTQQIRRATLPSLTPSSTKYCVPTAQMITGNVLPLPQPRWQRHYYAPPPPSLSSIEHDKKDLITRIDYCTRSLGLSRCCPRSSRESRLFDSASRRLVSGCSNNNKGALSPEDAGVLDGPWRSWDGAWFQHGRPVPRLRSNINNNTL